MGRPKLNKNKPTKKGLGDIIEDVTKATGIKKVVGDCEGCNKRKELANDLGHKIVDFFRKHNPKEMTESEKEEWSEFINRKNQDQINPEEQKLIIRLLRDVLHTSVAPCVGCSGSAWKKYIDRINMVYENQL